MQYLDGLLTINLPCWRLLSNLHTSKFTSVEKNTSNTPTEYQNKHHFLLKPTEFLFKNTIEQVSTSSSGRQKPLQVAAVFHRDSHLRCDVQRGHAI